MADEGPPVAESPQRADERAANILNVVMVVLLSGAGAIFCLWVAFDFLRALSSTPPSVSWKQDGFTRFLTPLALAMVAASAIRSSLRRSRSESRSPED